MTVVACLILVLVGPPILFDAWRRPILRRMAFRNLRRRPAEAALVVIGSMLGTALIVTAFVVGDSVGTSFATRAETVLGPIDVLLTTDDADGDVTRLRAALAESPTDIDGLLAIRRADIIAANGQGKLEPNITIWEVDPAALKAFGNPAEQAGLGTLPDDLASTEAAINERLAADLGLAPGDVINLVSAAGVPVEMEIAAVLPTQGISFFAPVIVGHCSISCGLPSASDSFQDVVVISTDESHDTTGAATDATLSFISETLGTTTPPAPLKQQALDRADRLTETITTQFATVAGFSVAAGVLLLVNLFVMLSTERRVEIGTLRAVGLQQGTVRRAFTLECAAYSLLAVGLGALVGIGLGAMVVRRSANVFGADRQLRIEADIQPASVLAAVAIGLSISLVAGIVTSDRLNRLNIVAALKNATAPASPRSTNRRGPLVLAVLLILGSAVAFARFSEHDWVALITPVGVALGTGGLLSTVLSTRIAAVICAAMSLGWSLSLFALLPSSFSDPPPPFFLVQGLIMVGSAAIIVVVGDRRLVAWLRRAWRRSVSVRLGLAQPAADPVRSGLLLGMYSLVIFTVTFTAVVNHVLDGQSSSLAERAGGGYDLLVQSSRLAPVEAAELQAHPGVEVAVAVQPGSLVVPDGPAPDGPAPEGTASDGRTSETLRKRWAVAVGSAFAANGPPPRLVSRSGDFSNDQAVWQHLASGDDVVIAPSGRGFEVGETVTVVDASGSSIPLEVIGLSDYGYLANVEFYLPAATAESLLIDRAQYRSRHYLVLDEGTDADELAGELEDTFAGRGLDASSFLARIDEQADERQAFVAILQAFLGIGLGVGITGLSVAQIRNVRDRRPQLGMLRAIGFNGRTLTGAFLVEAAFVGARGVVVGIGLGVIMSWQVITRSAAFDPELGFGLPVVFLSVLAAIALSASLLAGIVPAIKAGRTMPAEALRLDT